jgi:hypothetical protein
MNLCKARDIAKDAGITKDEWTRLQYVQIDHAIQIPEKSLDAVHLYAVEYKEKK